MRSPLIIFLYLLITNIGFAGVSIKKIAKLPADLRETSGVELFKDKYILSHNDSGNEPELFVFNLKGELVKRILIKNVKNIDWEDITVDDDGNVYIADTGNNLNRRKKLFVYKINGEVIESTATEATAKVIEISYADQKDYPPKEHKLHYDVESIIWKNDSLFVFTKCRAVPFTGESFVYGFPAKSGKYKPDPKGPIQFCDSGWRNCSLVAADYDKGSNMLVALLYGKLCFIKNFEGSKFWEGDIVTYNIPGIKQREAICFAGKNALYMTDEYRRPIGGGNLYRISWK
jgi:hypothetical protein